MIDNHHLLSTICELKKELKTSKIELESMTKLVLKLNSSTNDLNKNLSCGKQVSDKRGVGFSNQGTHSERGESYLGNLFVPAKTSQVFVEVS